MDVYFSLYTSHEITLPPLSNSELCAFRPRSALATHSIADPKDSMKRKKRKKKKKKKPHFTEEGWTKYDSMLLVQCTGCCCGSHSVMSVHTVLLV